MIEPKKSRQQLLEEITALRVRLAEYKDAEAKHISIEEQSRIILQTAMDGFCIIDNKGYFKQVNEVYCRITGYTRDELLSMNLRDIEAFEIMAQTAKHPDKIKKTGTERFESRLKRKDGGSVDIEFSVNYYTPYDSGQLFLVVRDVTALKRAEEALREKETLLQTVIDSTKDAMISIGEDGLITLFNPAAEEMFGRKSEEMIGKSVDCLMPKEYRRQHREYIKSYFSTGKPDKAIGKVMELPGLHSDGTVFPMSISLSPGRFAGKQFVIAVARDITERKQAEENLRKSEERFRNIFENTTIGIYRTTPDGRILMANPALIQMLGFESFDELSKRNLEQDGFESDYPRSAFKQRIEREGQVTDMEFIWRRRDGTRIFIRENAKRIADKEGNTLYYEGTVEDITKRKLAEEELNIKDKAIESSINAFVISDFYGKLLYVNPSFLKMWGYDGADNVIGRNASEFWEFEVQALEVIDALQTEGKWSGELSAKRKDGSKFDVQILASIVKREAGEPDYIMASFLDITERKRAEESLKNSEQKHKTLVENIPGMVYRAYPDWSAEIFFGSEEICGYTPAELGSREKHWLDIIHPEDKEKVLQEGSEIIKEPKSVVQVYRIITKSGDVRWVEDRKTSVFNQEVRFVGIDGIVLDVTERRKTSLALEYRRKFERLVTEISRKFINLSPEQLDQGVNQALEALGEFAQVDRSYIFQFSDDGRRISNTHEWCAEGITSQIDNLQDVSVDMVPWWMGKLAKFEKIHIPDVEKLPSRAKNEKQMLQSQSIQSLIVIPMVYNRQLVGFVGFDSVRKQRTWSEESIAMLTIFSEIFTNTLMRRRIHEELDSYHDKMRRAEQLASLGMVSATIAHELNQPLTVIKLFLQQGLRALKDNNINKVTEVIDDCLDEVTKAASTVDRFRRFARKAAPIYVTKVDLLEVAERVVGLLTEGARRKKLDLSVNIKSRPPHIIGNSVELEQLFFILIQNAIQAADRQTQREMRIEFSKQAGHIQLTFADTCGGIEDENMNKIFEPFYTTKPPNIGTGLGLCILERIVKRHGGSVRVESRKGHGTIFYVGLPIKK